MWLKYFAVNQFRQSVTKLHQAVVPGQSIQKLKNLCQSSHYSISPSAVWQTLCAGLAISLQRLLHKQWRSVANGGAKRSLFCLWLVLLLDLEMCGDFHICATRMVVVSISVCYSLSGVFIPSLYLMKGARFKLFKLFPCCL